MGSAIRTIDLASATEENPVVKTPDSVFTAVSIKAQALSINTKNSKRWPSAANGFTRKLNDSKSALISCNWNFEVSHNGKSREMAIWRINPPKTPLSTPKRYCSKECVNFDKKECVAHDWRNLNRESIVPSGCLGFKSKSEKTGEKHD